MSKCGKILEKRSLNFSLYIDIQKLKDNEWILSSSIRKAFYSHRACQEKKHKIFKCS